MSGREPQPRRLLPQLHSVRPRFGSGGINHIGLLSVCVRACLCAIIFRSNKKKKKQKKAVKASSTSWEFETFLCEEAAAAKRGDEDVSVRVTTEEDMMWQFGRGAELASRD